MKDKNARESGRAAIERSIEIDPYRAEEIDQRDLEDLYFGDMKTVDE